MRRCVTAGVVALAGCAQLVGIDGTSKTAPDGSPPDARPVDGSPDAPRACVDGDARITDVSTGACYMFFASPMTRDAARTACGNVGAQLASIQSATEATLIGGLIGTSDAFAGGSDELIEGMWRWDDGTPFQLTSWNTGEPNNGAGMLEEDCLVLIGALGAKWDDRPCAPPPINPAAGAYAFVCKRR